MITATQHTITAINQIKLPNEITSIITEYYGIHPKDKIVHNIKMSVLMLRIKDMGEYLEMLNDRHGNIMTIKGQYDKELQMCLDKGYEDSAGEGMDFFSFHYQFYMTRGKKMARLINNL